MQLPEVVRAVLQHVHADGGSAAATLAAAVRVSRTWFACGVDLLWRALPLSSALDGVAAPERAAFYAEMIVACEGIPAAGTAGGVVNNTTLFVNNTTLFSNRTTLSVPLSIGT
jgi:hypothetical protein